jgi:hypothetical protein
MERRERTCGERKLGPRQEVPDIRHTGERRDVIGDPSVAVLLGHQECIPELPQGLFAEHGGQEEAVGLEHAPDLGQHARQGVDPVQRQVGDDQIEGALFEGGQLLVGHHALWFYCDHDTHDTHDETGYVTSEPRQAKAHARSQCKATHSQDRRPSADLEQD